MAISTIVDFSQTKILFEDGPKRARDLMSKVMRQYALDFFDDITYLSPVDTEAYRASWEPLIFSTKGNTFFSTTFANKMPYSGPLDYGSPVGGKPWPSPGPKTVVGKDGRIFSKQAPEGVSSKVITEETLNTMVDDIIKEFGGF